MAKRRDSDGQVPANTAKPPELYFRDVGRGDVILLLHGFPLNGRMWQPQIDLLQSRARLIAPDLPGFGLSAGSQNTSFAAHATAVSALLDRLGVNRLAIVALAEGNYVALHLVEELGAKLLGLVLASPDLLPVTNERKSRAESLVAEVLLDGSVDPAMNEYLPRLIGPTAMRAKPELLDEIRSIALENTPASVAAGLTALASRPDYAPYLSNIRCPVMCLRGEEDISVPPEHLALITDRIPGALSRTLPRCGPLCNVENPVEFNETVLSLLAESLSTGTGS